MAHLINHRCQHCEFFESHAILYPPCIPLVPIHFARLAMLFSPVRNSEGWEASVGKLIRQLLVPNFRIIQDISHVSDDIWWQVDISCQVIHLGVSIKMGVPLYRWMAYFHGKMPSIKMNDNWGYAYDSRNLHFAANPSPNPTGPRLRRSEKVTGRTPSPDTVDGPTGEK